MDITRRTGSFPGPPRRAAGAALLLALTAACGGEADSGPLESNGRPVVLISIDSLRADHCSAYGYRAEFAPEQPTTPFLERMAAEGVLFDQAEASSSWTLPSHISLVTGMHCLEHGVRNRLVRLDEDAEHIAGRFRRAGYHTGGFYSGPFLHPAWGFGHGFDEYRGSAAYLRGRDALEAIVDVRLGSLRELHHSSHRDKECSTSVVDQALEWLEQEQRYQEPFFLFLHLWDPHYDYEPPQAYADMFLPAEHGPRFFHDFMEADWGANELPAVKALYDAEIRYTDDQIARLWSRLEEWGIADRVLLAITSDHGDEFFEHGDKGHQKTLYEEVTRIPMVLRAPGLAPAGRVVQSPVALYDVAPTLLDLAGIAPWSGRSGSSLRPFWEGGGEEQPILMDLEMPGARAAKLRGWRRGADKVIWNPVLKEGEIFDLGADPEEQRPARLQSLLSSEIGRTAWDAFQAWRGKLGRTLPMEETQEMRSLLAEVGYVEEGSSE